MNTQQHHIYAGVQRAFEKALHTYDDASVIQQHVGHLLIDTLSKMNPVPKHILDLGCGTGLITANLYKTLSPSSLHINDFSQALLDKACHQLQPFQPKTCPFNFDTPWPCTHSYDLIFSNMAFQWSLDIHRLFSQCHHHLNKDGILAFSLPLRGSFFNLAVHQRLTFHKFEDISHLLSHTGFDLLKSDHLQCSQVFETYLQALKSIKQCGANYVPHKKHKPLIDRSKLFLPSTLHYQIGIFIARKGN